MDFVWAFGSLAEVTKNHASCNAYLYCLACFSMNLFSVADAFPFAFVSIVLLLRPRFFIWKSCIFCFGVAVSCSYVHACMRTCVCVCVRLSTLVCARFQGQCLRDKVGVRVLLLVVMRSTLLQRRVQEASTGKNQGPCTERMFTGDMPRDLNHQKSNESLSLIYVRNLKVLEN